MGLYIRLAPCVRVRISKRGIRWAIGPACRPTASRCGRPGGSTGAGPVSVYWGLRRRGSGRVPRRYSWRDVMAEFGRRASSLLKPLLARAGNYARAGLAALGPCDIDRLLGLHRHSGDHERSPACAV